MRETAPDGSFTEYAYDALGNITTETSSASEGQTVVTSTYDLGGRLLSQTDEAQALNTSYEYDLLGRTICTHTSADPDPSGSQSVYNTLGWLLRERDAQGTATRNTYDGAGQVTHSVCDGVASETIYDETGAVLAESGPAGDSCYDYDAFGRQVELQHDGAESASDSHTTLVLDSLGRPLSTTDEIAQVTETFAYPQDEPPSAQVPAATLPARWQSWDSQEKTTTNVYQAADGTEERRTTVLSEELSLDREVVGRDGAGNATAVSLDMPDGATLQLHDMYNDMGDHQRQWGAGFAAGAETAEAYSYEAGSGQKIAEDIRLAYGGAIIASYGYDSAGRLTRCAQGNTVTTDTYDAHGRLSESRRSNSATTTRTIMSYEADSDRLHAIRSGSQTTVFAWDEKGRRTAQGPPNDPRQIQYGYGWGYGSSYPGSKQLSGYDNYAGAGHIICRINYDAAGQPTKLSDNRAFWADRLRWQDGLLLEVKTDHTCAQSGLQGSLAYLYDESGCPYAASFVGQGPDAEIKLAFSLVSTDNGDVVELLDANGEPFAAYRYDAWGKPIATQTRATQLLSADLAVRIAERQLLRWHGYLYDAAMGLYWADGRWYDAASRQSIAPVAKTVKDSPQAKSGRWHRRLRLKFGHEGFRVSTEVRWYTNGYALLQSKRNGEDGVQVYTWYQPNEVRGWYWERDTLKSGYRCIKLDSAGYPLGYLRYFASYRFECKNHYGWLGPAIGILSAFTWGGPYGGPDTTSGIDYIRVRVSIYRIWCHISCYKAMSPLT